MEQKKPERASESRMLKAALYYASKRFPVLPFHTAYADRCSCQSGPRCGSPGKHPRTEHGYKDATADPRQVRDWWKKWPDASVGMATGRVSGYTVLDEDGPEAAKLIEKHCPEGTRSQTTPSGGRQHFFKHEEGLGNWVRVLPDLDIRNDGSQVVLPPSPGRSWDEVDGEYKPVRKLPKGLWDEILQGRRQKDKAINLISKGLSEVLVSKNVELPEDLYRRLDGVKEKFGIGDRISEGTRNDTLLKIGSSMRGHGVVERSIVFAITWVNANLCDPPLSDDECRKVIESVLKLKEEINRLVDGFEEWLETRTFKGKAGGTDKRLCQTLFDLARGVGRKGVDGLEVSVGQLDLALKAGVENQETVSRALKRMPYIKSEKRSGDITHSNTIVILYPNGSYIDEHGEVIVRSFQNYSSLSSKSHNSSLSSSSKGREYWDYDFTRKTRSGHGRPGFTQMDVLGKLIKNMGIGVPFRAGDCLFIKKDRKAVSNILCKLAASRWRWLEKKSRGVYMVPNDIRERYEQCRAASGESEDEKDQLEKTERRRATWRYKQDLDRASKEGRDLEAVQVPECVLEPESTRAIEVARQRRIDVWVQEEAAKRVLSGRLGWASLADYFSALDNVRAELTADGCTETPGDRTDADRDHEGRSSAIAEAIGKGLDDRGVDQSPEEVEFSFGARKDGPPLESSEGLRQEFQDTFEEIFGHLPGRTVADTKSNGPNSRDYFYEDDVFRASRRRRGSSFGIARDLSERVWRGR